MKRCTRKSLWKWLALVKGRWLSACAGTGRFHSPIKLTVI
jgi:hypothetical protein